MSNEDEVYYVVETRDNEDTPWRQFGSTRWYVEDDAADEAQNLQHYYRFDTRVVKATSYFQTVRTFLRK